MAKVNVVNEKLKRKYFKYLKEGLGYSQSTINAVEKALLRYEDYTDQEDYSRFSKRKAVGFKKALEAKIFRGKRISMSTVYCYLRHLKSFFVWLSGQPGYKSKINLNSVSYLSLERKKVKEALSPKKKKIPSLEYVKKLTDSIVIKSEIDQRDRALISFLLLSGMRDKAVSTLPLGCFNLETLEINQDPKLGVDTKFGKRILTTLFKFDTQLINYVIEWSQYLEKCKFFTITDPLFPRSKVDQVENGLAFVCRAVEPKFWRGTSSIRNILKSRSSAAEMEYFNPHSFRHAAVHIALRYCRTPEEMKAISQNLGHEYVGTTMMTYGNLDEYRVAEVVKKIDFSKRSSNTDKDNLIDEIVKKVNNLR